MKTNKTAGLLAALWMTVAGLGAAQAAMTIRVATGEAAGESLFTNQVPVEGEVSDGAGMHYELGMRFRTNEPGHIKAIRFYKAAGEQGATHTGKIYRSERHGPVFLASVDFENETASGWQEQALDTPLAIEPRTEYIVAVNTGNTYYVKTEDGLDNPVSHGALRSMDGPNGVYRKLGTYEWQSWNNSNYFRDVVFVPNNPIRTDINQRTFGGGLQFNSSQLRWTMENLDNPDDDNPPVSSLTGDTIKWLELGTLRFPGGTQALHYVSESPGLSMPSIPRPNQWNRYLSPEEIIDFTAGHRLDMQRIFQVNTHFWLDQSANDPCTGYWPAHRYVNTNGGCASGLPEIDPANLAKAAEMAAKWVERDAGRTAIWEVGNEEWARWNAAQNAEIFYEFQKQMKAVRPDIRLLVQGLEDDYAAGELGVNTPEAWLNALKTKLAAHDAIDSVYAYSIHDYTSGGLYPNADPLTRRRNQTRDMLAKVASGEPVNKLKTLLGIGTSDALTRDWKLWMTEFNVWQPSGEKDANGNNKIAVLQDMGHALVIADWTGKLLEQNVERLIMHSLDNHPAFALVQYQNEGATIDTPYVTPPGYAFRMYAKAFGDTMLRNTIDGNVTLNAPNGKTYPQLAVYSSLNEEDQSLRLMVINRHLTDKVYINIDTLNAPGRRWFKEGDFQIDQLFASQVTANNRDARGSVKWTGLRSYPQYVWGVRNVELPPASVNFFIMPLQKTGL